MIQAFSHIFNFFNIASPCGDMGPSFGGGFDIHICNEANLTPDSYSNLGFSYQHPQPSQGQSYLAGSHQFQLSEIEVYKKE
jgi:hypothetical protein